MIGTTQVIINWGRNYIPDPKTRTVTIRDLEIGRTFVPTSQRETFYIRHQASGTVSLYVQPYLYSSSPTLKTAATTAKVFMFNATLQSCTFPSASDPSIRPDQYLPVLANYEYNSNVNYAYSDTELVGMIPQAIEYLNNDFGLSYSYTGTISTLAVTSVTNSGKEIIARGLAVIVRKSYVAEQMRRGLGVAFRGPMAAIDSKTQLNAYMAGTNILEKSIQKKVDEDALAGGSGSAIDIYSESVVDT